MSPRAGADVPACLEPQTRMMREAVEEIGPALGLASLPAALINPGVPVPAAQVFKALSLTVGQDLAGAPHPMVPQNMATAPCFKS